MPSMVEQMEMAAAAALSTFTVVLTATTTGWSTGWNEASRNTFTPAALSAVMTEWNTHSMAEVTELVFHFWGQGRERPQPHIMKNGSVMGFRFNVYPLLQGMKEAVEKHDPQLAAAFNALKDTKEFKEFKAAGDDPKRSAVASEAFNKLLAERFGKTITVLPQTKSETPEVSINTLLKHFKKDVKLVCRL